MGNKASQQFIDGIADSVVGKRRLSFEYQGHARLACGYLLGKTKDDRLVLHAYQYGGAGSKGEVTDPSLGTWRFFYLDEMSDKVTAFDSDNVWYPLEFKKSEADYVPPKFITQVLAITP